MPNQKDQHSLSSPNAIFQSAPINQTMVKNTHTQKLWVSWFQRLKNSHDPETILQNSSRAIYQH
jgi:hypothetical protein